MDIREVKPDDGVMTRLIELSEDWEKENSCRGYRKNTPDDIKGCRIFLALVGETVVGYLLARRETEKKGSTVCDAGTPYYEIEELYIVPDYRGRGIGGELFRAAENALAEDAEYIILSTATKDHKAILHFYIDEMDMSFWSARLFKKLGHSLPLQ